MNPPPFPQLLVVAAHVLEAATDLPPVDVGLEPGAAGATPVTLTPAPVLDIHDQHALVHIVATACGWSAERLAGSSGWQAGGAVDGVGVRVTSSPGPTAGTPFLRRPDASSTSHASLLRTLVDWSGTLIEGVRELHVKEDLETGTGPWALIRVEPAALEAVIAAHALVRVPGRPLRPGYRAEGILPTGHRLMIST